MRSHVALRGKRFMRGKPPFPRFPRFLRMVMTLLDLGTAIVSELKVEQAGVRAGPTPSTSAGAIERHIP
jgi:hypothetical protein